MSWTFEIGQGALRGYVVPMDGGAYRMTVTRPGGACSLFVGLRSLASAVETFCTQVALAGESVPPGAREEWDVVAAGLDARGTAVPS